MNIQEATNFLNFWINKYLGGYYSITELMEVIDRGQISLYSDLQPKYATSQHIKDALSPFRDSYSFGYSDSLNGIVTIPSDRNYLNLLDMSISYWISGRGIRVQVPVALVNEDVRANRLNSQVDPVSATQPFGEMIGVASIQIYPEIQYSGAVTFLRRPVKPVFGYTVVSGRVIVYDPNTSTQLEWSEQWQNAVLVKGLESIGINLSSAEISQYAELKTQSNFQNVNRL